MRRRSVSTWRALGTTAMVVVTRPDDLAAARAVVEVEIDSIDRACSRFRDDSELTRLNQRSGHPVEVSPILGEAIDVALRGAHISEGRVDPTLGGEIRRLGYDRDFAAVPPDGPALGFHLPQPGRWGAIALDRPSRTVCVPAGVELDLGATAKALAADRAASLAAEATGGGVLVSLGGDIAVAGVPPAGGWSIRVTDDHSAGPGAAGASVAIFSGGLATSSTAVRHWRRGDSDHHHILDPATGRSACSPWRTVSAAAGTCVDANLATTNSIVLGAHAPRWLGERDLPSRLVGQDGSVVVVAGWPSDEVDP